MKFNPKYASVNEDGTLAYAPVPLVINGANYWTNIADKYTEKGYYPVENTAMPVTEGFYYTSRYELKDGKATLVWDEHAVEIPIENPEEGL